MNRIGDRRAGVAAAMAGTMVWAGAAWSGAPTPVNDDCTDALAVSEGVTGFTTVGATTDGPDEPALCTRLGASNVLNDVWFRYIHGGAEASSLPGYVIVDLCGTSYDSRVALYADTDCPTTESALACNDDFDCDEDGFFGDDNWVSRVWFPATEALIRIGGYNGATGDGVMTITFVPGCPVIGDGNGDGAVNFTDLEILLEHWNTEVSPGTNGDANISGRVNFADLEILLENWGQTCSF